MEAKVKNDYRWNTLIAFSGVEYIKNEFRPVPEWAEAEAKAHESLEVREDAVKSTTEEVVDPVDEKALELAEAEEAFPPPRKRHRKPKVEEA